MIDCREDSRPCSFGKMHEFKLIVKEGVLIFGCRYCGVQHRTKTPWDNYRLTPKSDGAFSVIGNMEFPASDFVVGCKLCLN